MSVMGQPVRVMTALPPIADIRRRRWDVRKVPQADIPIRRSATSGVSASTATSSSNWLLTTAWPRLRAACARRQRRSEMRSALQRALGPPPRIPSKQAHPRAGIDQGAEQPRRPNAADTSADGIEESDCQRSDLERKGLAHGEIGGARRRRGKEEDDRPRAKSPRERQPRTGHP